ncbi:HHL034Cp [Eremothecium sinecaudum]|uniref:Dolichol phosphate-mannose biosynthesis regulatory protein n=1 Tax=Eremothecium sinecaudum TaxID=45286 RepID=A0A0X8HVZ4_9SACH|nr:HHL034Cp [Eremothecium sinecaudum]AMD22736.1 HHL034Cp [Eremothecium sinecaudum]
MFKLTLVVLAFIYYTTWLLLPVFNLDGACLLFPIPSKYAVLLPIILLLFGVLLVGTFIGVLLMGG